MRFGSSRRGRRRPAAVPGQRVFRTSAHKFDGGPAGGACPVL